MDRQTEQNDERLWWGMGELKVQLIRAVPFQQNFCLPPEAEGLRILQFFCRLLYRMIPGTRPLSATNERTTSLVRFILLAD